MFFLCICLLIVFFVRVGDSRVWVIFFCWSPQYTPSSQEVCYQILLVFFCFSFSLFSSTFLFFFCSYFFVFLFWVFINFSSVSSSRGVTSLLFVFSFCYPCIRVGVTLLIALKVARPTPFNRDFDTKPLPFNNSVKQNF